MSVSGFIKTTDYGLIFNNWVIFILFFKTLLYAPAPPPPPPMFRFLGFEGNFFMLVSRLLEVRT